MARVPLPSARKLRPVARDTRPNYYQMHIYDKEKERLQTEQAELLKRLNIIEERVKVIQAELQRLGNVLNRKL